MSTKTLRKRIALVAVSALGFGLVSTVPASAAQTTVTAASAAAVTTTVGTATDIPVTFGTLGATIDAACVLTVTLTAHTGLTINAANANGSTLTATNGWAVANSSGALQMTATSDYTATTPALTSGKVIGSLNVTPTKAGVYTGILTSAASTNTGCAISGTATTTFTLTVGTNSSLVALQGDGGTPTLNNAVTGVAGPANFVTAELVIPTTVSATIRRLVVADSGVKFLTATTTNGTGGTNTNTTTIAEDKQSVEVVAVQDSTAKTAHGRTEIRIATPTAGTFAVKVYNGAQAGIYSATASETITITVAAAASNGTLSVANSSTLLDKDATAGGSYAAPTADETVSVVRTAGTAAGIVKVALKDVLNNAMASTTLVSATISGPGLIALDSTMASATYANASRAESGYVDGSGFTYLAIYADGTSGVGTVTISVGTTVVSTETVTFYGSGAKYVATVYKSTVASSGSASTDAVCVTVTDSNGVVVPGHRVYADLGTATAATIEANDLSDSLGDACFDVTGVALKSGPVSITFRNAATAAAATVSTTAEVTISSVRAATLTITTDKAEYAPGEKMTFTLTAKDSNGYGIPTASYAADALLNNLASNPVMSYGFSTTPFLGTSAVSIKGGVATATAYAPLVSGPVSLTWTLDGTAGGAATTNLAATLVGTSITATANVTQTAAETAATAASDAAAEATDAANAATDAANAAAEAADAATAAAQDAADAVAALSTQVSEMVNALKKQITALTNLVIKIQKKVRA